MRKMQSLMGAILLGTVLSGPASAQTVVKDHVSDPARWSDDVGGLLDHFIDPSPDWTSVVGIAITGNGEKLSKVGIIFGTYVGADLSELQWRFRFFPDTASFSIGAMLVPPPQPNWDHVFDTPSNENWTDVIHNFLGFADERYVEVDVSSLAITTTPGQTHLIVLVPESKVAVPTTITSIAMSGGTAPAIGTLPDWCQQGVNFGGAGPGSLDILQLGQGWSFAASKVITVAGPCAQPPSSANADKTAVCSGQPVQLSATPGAGGDTIEWFTGSCGGVLIATGTSITVNPTTDTTYFARTKNTSTSCVSDECAQVGPVQVRPYAKADFNQDCAVDQADLTILIACGSGPDVPYLPDLSPGCTLPVDGSSHIAADFDTDGDVDATDFAALQRCFGTLQSPADPACLP